MATWMPRARSGRARSSARGDWFDCTPASMTMTPPAVSLLRAEEQDHAAAGFLDHPRQPLRADARVGLVEGVNVERDAVAQDPALRAVARQPVQRRQRVRRDRRAQPLDDVAIVVVVRWLDQR